jgi:peptide/nickel transport system substrate-binding protein
MDTDLRDGLRFHDGDPVLARDVVASLRRWSKRDPLGGMLFAATDELTAPSDRVIRFRMNRRFTLLPDALSKTSPMACIMPERLAKTDPNTPLAEMIGSGPTGSSPMSVSQARILPMRSSMATSRAPMAPPA